MSENDKKKQNLLMKTILILISILIFLFFYVFLYREHFTPETETSKKICFHFSSKAAINQQKTGPIKASELLGGDYDRLCIMGPIDKTQYKQTLGREIGFLEYPIFWFIHKTGGESYYGNQFLYEKNNKIVKHEAANPFFVRPEFDFKNPNSNLSSGCMKYSSMYFTQLNKEQTLHLKNMKTTVSSYIIFFEKKLASVGRNRKAVRRMKLM